VVQIAEGIAQSGATLMESGACFQSGEDCSVLHLSSWMPAKGMSNIPVPESPEAIQELLRSPTPVHLQGALAAVPGINDGKPRNSVTTTAWVMEQNEYSNAGVSNSTPYSRCHSSVFLQRGFGVLFRGGEVSCDSLSQRKSVE